ncbi:metal ABC transporter ATP-binding protein [Pseudoruegeria sp. SK021]|uniref:metal ABC transporter ATP-binding protein n=1 Tax=Pseudoruegeria sp. SK021 TaxID=1933035 RepID=UPI000A226E91|nr:metal ABC transporter ATP-binding protein [Pseudoruegeria sp. SK021]OSP54040.1 zinc ABC transporter ATP-binding protein ZnuC [Pseudoruegeria sp. SK021]
MSLIELQDVSVRLGGHQALSHVSLTIAPGEIVTVVGPNGSGKTTLLRCIIGAVEPQSGAVRRQPGLRIGYVPQTLAIDPTLPMTAGRFLGLPHRRPARDITEALIHAGADGLAQRQLSALSGGQFRRVLLARALLERPALLILDEPTTGLDQPGSAAFYRRIEQVRRELGCAVLMVSHELHVVMSASDRVICLNVHVCCNGTPDVVASAPEYRALFGSGTGGALALYRHDHTHSHDDGAASPPHDPPHESGHSHGPDCTHTHTTGAPH